MTAPGTVQSKGSQISGSAASVAVTLDSTATAGNTLILWSACLRGGGSGRPKLPTGWTLLERADVSGAHDFSSTNVLLAYKVSAGTESTITVTFEDTTPSAVNVPLATLHVVEVNGTLVTDAIGNNTSGATQNLPDITPGSGIEAYLWAGAIMSNAYGRTGDPSGYTFLDDQVANTGVSIRSTIYDRYDASTSSGPYGGTITYAGSAATWYGAQVLFAAIPPVPLADFTYDLGDGFEPQTVDFTDTSEDAGGTITAWAWDFGDGGTSASQNPSHLYSHGTYTVTLTITIAAVDYTTTQSLTILVDVGYTPPLPGLALVEIYATSPGSARWDLANWDEAVWSSDSWQNVTPESTDVTIVWGSQRPELGILSTPDAASWGIGFYDPQRLLDPANADSPFFGDIVPGLPVRVTHRGWVVKQGILESAGHNFDLNDFKSHNSGYFRVTDSQSLMARSKVPSDTTLGDTLFDRARDAIAAAGLSIRVVPEGFASSPLGDVLPIGHVHDLVPWVTGTDWSVWQWITDAAAQVLHVPYINRTGELGFRQWGLPKDNAKSLRSPNLVGLGSVIFQNGTYSVVTALDDDGVTLRTAEVTPKPYYGAVTYDDRATKPTPNAQDWADAVLADRAVAGLRWVPGEVFPLTANDVRYFAEIEALERVSIDYVEANPPISATGIVVGGQMVITPVQEREARWSFLFQVAATEDQPLVDDDAPASFLVNDDDPTDYLYPG